MAGAGPQVKGFVWDLVLDVGAEVFVWDENDFFLGEAFGDVDAVGAGAADVGEGFDVGVGVNVGHDGGLGVFLFEESEVGGCDHVGHGAGGGGVGEDDGFVGVEDFGSFGHEADAAEDDGVGVGLGGFESEVKGVAAEVGDVLDFWPLVIVGENDDVVSSF